MHQHDASDEDSDSDDDGDIRKSLGSFPPNFNFLDMQNMYQNTKDLQEIRYCWAEEAFKVASKLKEKSILQRVYDEMIAALSMTTMDGIMVKSVIPIMELLLGREDDCYKFVVWHMTRDYSMPDWDRCKGKFSNVLTVKHTIFADLPLGKWREMEGLNKYEDVFEVVKRRPPPTPAMNKFVSQPMKPQGPDDLDLGMLLGLIGIKLLAINRYEEGAKAFAKKSSEEFAIGSLTKKVYKDQYRQLKKYLKRAQMFNDSILPALVNPQPLLNQPATHHVKFGDIFETKRLVDKYKVTFIALFDTFSENCYQTDFW